jgi:hypothetical protein
LVVVAVDVCGTSERISAGWHKTETDDAPSQYWFMKSSVSVAPALCSAPAMSATLRDESQSLS